MLGSSEKSYLVNEFGVVPEDLVVIIEALAIDTDHGVITDPPEVIREIVDAYYERTHNLKEKVMHYGVLTNLGEGGMPFENNKRPPTAPGDPLRLSEDATLLAFANQPDRVFANQYARASGKLLWYVAENILHPDDLPAAETFSSYREFQTWIRQNPDG